MQHVLSAQAAQFQRLRQRVAGRRVDEPTRLTVQPRPQYTQARIMQLLFGSVIGAGTGQ
jgi:hypothetical protein